MQTLAFAENGVCKRKGKATKDHLRNWGRPLGGADYELISSFGFTCSAPRGWPLSLLFKGAIHVSNMKRSRPVREGLSPDGQDGVNPPLIKGSRDFVASNRGDLRRLGEPASRLRGAGK